MPVRDADTGSPPPVPYPAPTTGLPGTQSAESVAEALFQEWLSETLRLVVRAKGVVDQIHNDPGAAEISALLHQSQARIRRRLRNED